MGGGIGAHEKGEALIDIINIIRISYAGAQTIWHR